MRTTRMTCSRLTVCAMLLLSLLALLLGSTEAEQLVPVMLWCPDCSAGLVNPLHKTSRQEFEELLGQHLGKTQPPAVVFVKDNFCVEDVRRYQKVLQKLNGSKSLSYLTYLTSVESALLALETLPYNITTDDDLDINDGQLAMIPINDLNLIPEKYNTLRESNSNLVTILTGRSCHYTTSTERVKREVKDDDKNSTKILFYIEENPYVKVDNKDWVKLGNATNKIPSIEGIYYNLTLSYKGIDHIPSITLTAHFEKSLGYYNLLGIVYAPEGDSSKAKYLKTRKNIEFPSKFSYHCSQNITFSYKDNTNEILVALANLQVQMDVAEFSSNVYDCVEFMSIPIWTGIFVTIILALIIIWGLVMILDIRTMDRFDDPKGKTITISAQE